MIQDMLANAVHIGFKRQYWSPKMREYIYGVQNDVHVFDLYKTAAKLEEAKRVLAEASAKGKTVLVVGTKVQARDMVRELAVSTGHLYVDTKWVPGLLTNFATLKRRIGTFVTLEKDLAMGDTEGLTKKELVMRAKEVAELRKAYEGVRDMKKLPDMLLIIDGKYENLALQEARKMNLPVVALLGSTGDIDMADYFVPCNVNSIKALKFVLDQLKASLVRPKQDANSAGAAKIKKIDQKPGAEELASDDIPAETDAQ